MGAVGQFKYNWPWVMAGVGIFLLTVNMGVVACVNQGVHASTKERLKSCNPTDVVMTRKPDIFSGEEIVRQWVCEGRIVWINDQFYPPPVGVESGE